MFGGKRDQPQIDIHFESESATIHYSGPAVEPSYVGRLIKALRASTNDLPPVKKPAKMGFSCDAIGGEVE